MHKSLEGQIIDKGVINLKEKTESMAQELLVGAYDLHVHTLPSTFQRLQDGFELVREADSVGMSGVMLKSHYESTAARAALINAHSGCRAKAYGGLALNWPAGGLNIYAVENALKLGAKIIWMPTRDAENSLRSGNMEGDFFSRPGISILNDDGTLKSCVYEIIDAVKRYDAFLATGHISPEESVVLCKAARARDAQIILTHPEFDRTFIEADVQKELADLGVVVEKAWYNVAAGTVTVARMAQTIKILGSSRAYIVTDRGQAGLPSAVSEYRRFIAELLEQGLTFEELRDLTHNVPESIVG